MLHCLYLVLALKARKVQIFALGILSWTQLEVAWQLLALPRPDPTQSGSSYVGIVDGATTVSDRMFTRVLNRKHNGAADCGLWASEPEAGHPGLQRTQIVMRNSGPQDCFT